MALDTGTDYKTTTLATVYKIENETLTRLGYLERYVTLQFSATTTFDGSNYGRISSASSTYKENGVDTRKSAVGCYVLEGTVARVSGGTEQNEFTDKNGTTTTINAIATYPPATYTVKSGKTLICYSGPGTSYSSNDTKRAGDTIAVYAEYTSPSSGIVWGAIDSGRTKWVIVRYANGNLNANLSSAGTQAATDANHNANPNPTIDDKTDALAQMDAALANSSALAANTAFDDESLEGLHNMQYVIGIPPYITRTADPHYMEGASPSNPFGRCYTEMYMMGNTIFSIQPLKVKYLPGFSDEERGYFYNAIANAVGGLGDDEGIESELSGQLFEGQPDYNDYINTVNLLARTMAIYLGIGDRTYRTGVKYRNMDYSWYKVRDNSHRTEGDGSLFATITSPLRWAADKLVTSVVNDDTYIHFYMTSDGTGINESMSVSTKSSSIESLFNNNLSSIAQEIQFLTGAETGIDFSNALADVVNSVGNVAGSFSQTLGNLVQYGANYLKGGRLVFPQMLDDCTYDRSYTGSCRFVSPSGDPEAIFLNCYLPLAYILPYVLPQMLSDNMYKYPFLCRINAQGLFHCDLAAMTNLRIQRGGQDGTAWTADGLPFEIDVSFDITPLYSKLMVTSARHPVLFLSNSALQEYLGALCGVSFTGYQFELKLNILKSIMGNYLSDTIPSMLRGYYSTNVAEWLRRLFNF